MKRLILCPLCAEMGRKPKILGKYEDIVGKGTIFLWCKPCGREIPIRVDEISIDR